MNMTDSKNCNNHWNNFVQMETSELVDKWSQLWCKSMIPNFYSKRKISSRTMYQTAYYSKFCSLTANLNARGSCQRTKDEDGSNDKKNFNILKVGKYNAINHNFCWPIHFIMLISYTKISKGSVLIITIHISLPMIWFIGID